MAAKSNEAFFWSLFSAGGVMSALFIPAIIISTGFLLPTEDPTTATERYEQVVGVVAHPITKLILTAVIFFSFMHCAHRIQHTAKDLGMRPVGGLIALACYLGAVVASVVSAAVIWQIHAIPVS